MLKKSASVVFIASIVSSHPCTDDLYKVHHHHHRRHHHHYGTCRRSFFPDQSACNKKNHKFKDCMYNESTLKMQDCAARASRGDCEGTGPTRLESTNVIFFILICKLWVDIVWFAITRSPINSLKWSLFCLLLLLVVSSPCIFRTC